MKIVERSLDQFDDSVQDRCLDAFRADGSSDVSRLDRISSLIETDAKLILIWILVAVSMACIWMNLRSLLKANIVFCSSVQY